MYNLYINILLFINLLILLILRKNISKTILTLVLTTKNVF